jgi:uncharacterized membrane protein YgcG
MSDDDVPAGEMPSNLFPFRRREPAVSADEVDVLLSGESPGPFASPEAQALGEVVAALRSAGRPNELAGASAAVAAFAEAAGSGLGDPDTARRRTVLTPLIGAKLLIAAVAGSIALGGAAAAAGIALPGSSTGAHAIGRPALSSDHASASTSLTESPTAVAAAKAKTSPSPTTTPWHPHPARIEPGSLVGLCHAYTARNSSDQQGLDVRVLAKLQALAATKGVTVAQLCTAALAAVDPKNDGTCSHGPADDPSDPARSRDDSGHHDPGGQSHGGSNGHSADGGTNGHSADGGSNGGGRH